MYKAIEVYSEHEAAYVEEFAAFITDAQEMARDYFG